MLGPVRSFSRFSFSLRFLSSSRSHSSLFSSSRSPSSPFSLSPLSSSLLFSPFVEKRFLSNLLISKNLLRTEKNKISFSRYFSTEEVEDDLDEDTFTHIVDDSLEDLACIFEEITEPLPFECDVNNASGVLTLSLGEKGTYVLNKQTPNRQLWLSSPISGPKRYRYDQENEVWLNTRDSHSLSSLLEQEIEQLLQIKIKLDC